MGGKWGQRCPRCGAVASAQRHKPRTVDYSKLNPAGIFNPVDAVLCPHCGEAFRVSKLETEGEWIVDWQTEFEFVPRFCPNCGEAFEIKEEPCRISDEKEFEEISKPLNMLADEARKFGLIS